MAENTNISPNPEYNQRPTGLTGQDQAVLRNIAQQRLATNTKIEYGGIFRGEILSVDTAKGTADIKPFGIGPDVAPSGRMTVRLTKISGGKTETSGITSIPSVGATCICAFEFAQGSSNAAYIINFVNPTQAGTIGLKEGDIRLATDRGLLLSLDNETNTVRLMERDQYGFMIANGYISYISKGLKINTYDGTNTSVINFNNNAASIMYESAKHSIKLDSKNFLQIVGQDFKASVTGNRDDVTIGEHHIQAGNLTNNAVHQLSLIGGEKMTASTTGDFDTTAKNSLTTTTLDNIRGSVGGNIIDFAQTGNVVLAAGTGVTTAVANSAGVAVAASKITLTTLGKIQIENNLSKTVHTIDGTIQLSGVRYTMDSKTTASLTSNLLMSLETKAMMTLTSKAMMSLKSNAVLNTESTLSTTIKSGASMTIDTAGVLSVKATAISVNTALPVLGLSTITIFGPMPLLPL